MKKAQFDIQRVGLSVDILIGTRRARDMTSPTHKLYQTLYRGAGTDHVEHAVHADATCEVEAK